LVISCVKRSYIEVSMVVVESWKETTTLKLQ